MMNFFIYLQPVRKYLSEIVVTRTVWFNIIANFYAGWNWESFAILPAPPVNGADILDYLETYGEITEVEGKEFHSLFRR